MSEFFDLKKLNQKKIKIGEGGYAKVYKVFDQTNDEVYAAKILKNVISDIKKTDLLNLKREINIISQLTHPCILKLIGYSPINFINQQKPVILLEYSANGSLSHILDLERRSLSPSQWNSTRKLINIFGIASAMSYLHSNNIIHRDLKPGNILEDDYLFPKIADFGFSKQYHQNQASMSTQSTYGLKGTLIYIAPEGLEDYKFTKAGDVYAFGIILYEIVTTEKPYEPVTNELILCSKIAKEGLRPQFKNPISDCYKELITRCWAHDPNDRPTFDEIVDLLKTRKEFITDEIDECEFLNYVDLIENSEKSFIPSKKFKKIFLPKSENENDENIEEDEDEYEDEELNDNDEDEPKIKIKEDIEKSYQKVQKSISKSSKNEKTQITKKSINQNYKILDQKTVIIPSNETVLLVEKDSMNSDEFLNSIKSFEKVVIENEYPSNKHDKFVSSVSNLLKKSKAINPQFIISDLNQVKTLSNLPFQFSVTFSPSVTKITKNGFSKFKQLKELTIPSSITEIESYAFQDCIALKRVKFEQSSQLSLIKDHAFSNCSSIEQIDLPSSVTKICGCAFKNCKLLKKVTMPGVIETGICVFQDCSSLKDVTISGSMSVIEDSLFSNCSSLSEVSIPSTVNKLNRNVFNHCSSLKKIQIPDSVTEIGINTFTNCISLTDISISSSLTKIPSNFCAICQSLTEITIPSSVIEIESNVFDRCSALKNVEFEQPSSLISLGNNVFWRCSSLEQIGIPSSVVKIGSGVFKDCKALKKLEIPSYLKQSIANLGIPKTINVDIKYI